MRVHHEPRRLKVVQSRTRTVEPVPDGRGVEFVLSRPPEFPYSPMVSHFLTVAQCRLRLGRDRPSDFILFGLRIITFGCTPQQGYLSPSTYPVRLPIPRRNLLPSRLRSLGYFPSTFVFFTVRALL